jgi:Holliday junction resolvasome RuvABC endonuclease subunit
LSAYLGIDPSLTATGWVLVDGDKITFGCIRTEPEQKKRRIYKCDDTTRRLELILNGINQQVGPQLYKEGVRVACEQPAGSQSALAAAALAEVHGALVAMLWSDSLLDGCAWIPARDAKLALTGDKSASKETMIEKARAWFMDCTLTYGASKDDLHRHAEPYFTELPKRSQEAIADALGVLLASKFLNGSHA